MAEKKTAGTKKEAPKSGKKAKVLSLKGTAKGDVTLPVAFDSDFRPDLIQRAFVAEQSWERQPYGIDMRAGLKTTADTFTRRRNYYRMTVNRGMALVPRQKRPGGGLGEVRRVPQAKGGRKAHAPKAVKKWSKKMNEKEWILALKSAVAATTNEDLLKGEGRNHAVKDITLPLIVENAFEALKKTKEVEEVFKKLGLEQDIERASKKKTKAGKARTGKKKLRTSVLIVVSGPCDVVRAAENLAGVDVIDAEGINVSLLAPGGYPGRLTLWTEGALEKLAS
jgi:large subunit ribosomal protein L4e